jgi:hypothetical protein
VADAAFFADSSTADAAKLRERIYGDVFPRLAEALAGARHRARPTAQDLAETYRMAMAALFQLLFLAHAPDRGGLPDEFADLADFRGLSVRDFGTIYEGLLESELAVAEVDLTTDRRGHYRPCQAGEAPVVEKGRVYLHNRSGGRKASGTWFTKAFAVDHLLDQALEPALEDHFARLDALDEAAAAGRLLDFRVADIAMGAGHFLIGAVDRIERALASYLSRRPLRGVQTELLRPLIASHCIYGVDLNPVAVDLARRTIGMHMLVPGLPLTLPERNLVAGNSLVQLPAAFEEVIHGERGGFDVIVGNPPWEKPRVEEHAFWARHVPGLRGLPQREQEALKARLRTERLDLVAAYERELAEAAALRKALTDGSYPGMGTGDPDLYKAFCWRFWRLLAPDGGRMGVVLPRSALNAKGSAEFRSELFRGARVDITVLHNTRGWVFDEAEHRYTIALLAACRRSPEGKSVRLRGPFGSLARFRAGLGSPAGEFRGEDVAAWTDAVALPLLPTEDSLEVFTRLRQAPRLDAADGPWRARPQTELHATNDKGLMDLASEECPESFWPVFKGESFDLWQPDTGRYYGWADPSKVLPHLQAKRLRSSRRRYSAHAEFDGQLRDATTLPCRGPRIAFRDITNRTNRRTVVAALVPPNVFLTHKGPFFLWPRGDRSDEAFLLGVLASLPLDWYARRFVETNLTYFILNPFPVPRPPRSSPLRRRVVQLAGCLAAPDERFAAWAEAVGVPWGPLTEAQRCDHIHELDAVVAHLYGLDEKHLVHIFETFHEGWDYAERQRETVQHFRRWQERV